MSKVIRREDLSDCKAWNVPDVQGKAAQSNRPVTARQLEEMHNQARQEGFQQGMKEGREAGLKEFQERVAMLDQLMRAFSGPLEELDESVEQQLAQLSMLVARQLVQRELKTDPAQVVGVVREALAALPLAAHQVRLALHPQDAALVREAFALQDREQDIQISEDPVQSRGGCRVITENSQIDATVESRLNAIIANVLGGQRSSDNTES